MKGKTQKSNFNKQPPKPASPKSLFKAPTAEERSSTNFVNI